MRIFNIEDNYFFRDMADVEKMIKTLEKKADGEVDNDAFDDDTVGAGKKVKPTKLKRNVDGFYQVQHADSDGADVDRPCGCCCISHCRVNEHKEVRGKLVGVSLVSRVKEDDMTDDLEFPNIYERDLFAESFDDEPMRQFSHVTENYDEIYEMLTSLETKFTLV